MATLNYSKLITKEQQWHANMTEQNHLGAALLIKPQLLQGTMNTLFSARNYYSDNPLSSMLAEFPHGTETITSTEWEWEMKGAKRRPLVVVDVPPGLGDTPGKNKSMFDLILDENWFLPGDILFPGTSDKSLQVRVMDEVKRYGNGWKYGVRIMSDDPEKFIPKKYLETGQLWTKLYSQYEEAAEQSGSTQFSLPIAFTNKMGRFRKEYKITDYASTEVLRVAIPGPDGKFYSSWIRYAEVEYWQQWYRELERALWYTRSTNTVMGANGRPVRSGPGIQEMLEESHIHRYTHLTAKLIEEYLMDIFYGRVKPGKGRHVKAFTGEYGMLAFHNAIEAKIGSAGFIKNFADITLKKEQSDLNPNAMSYGYQYIKYYMSNGSSLELIHNPLYDDRDLNFEIDPITGYPVESQRFTFLDLAPGEDGKSNIRIIDKKDGLAFVYVEGMYGPYGPNYKGKAAHAGSYYEMHIQKDQGIHIGDITKCGELILTRQC